MSDIKFNTEKVIEEINKVPINFEHGGVLIREWAGNVTGIIDQAIIELNDSDYLDKIQFAARKATITMDRSGLTNTNGHKIIKAVHYTYTIPNTDFIFKFTMDNNAEYDKKIME